MTLAGFFFSLRRIETPRLLVRPGGFFLPVFSGAARRYRSHPH